VLSILGKDSAVLTGIGSAESGEKEPEYDSDNQNSSRVENSVSVTTAVS